MICASIRVLLVDDSPSALAVMAYLLNNTPGIEVVGTARDGQEAIAMLEKGHPTIICTDYYMPKMNGLELTKHIMQTKPMPILVVSSLLEIKNSKQVFELLALGALDCIEKPTLSRDDPATKIFLEKVRVFSGVYVLGSTNKALSNVTPKSYARDLLLSRGFYMAGKPCFSIVAMGASTGGPSTLHSIVKQLPSNFPLPLVCVQHIGKGFLRPFLDWLQSSCALHIKIASDNEVLEKGSIYFPAEGSHLEIGTGKRAKISLAPPVDGQRPSVTVTMNSIAKSYGKESIAILLTGIGEDGAIGMEAVKKAGGATIAQSETGCVVFGMPRAAILRNAASFVMTPDEIASFLRQIGDAFNRTTP